MDSDYFTDAIDYTQVKELEEFESRRREWRASGARRCAGEHAGGGVQEAEVLHAWRISARAILSMPEQELHTTAFWLHLPESFLARFPDMTPTEKQSGLTGPGAGDAHRCGAAADVRSPGPGHRDHRKTFPGNHGSFEPDLFLFDNYPGGIGQSQPLFQMRSKAAGRRAGRAATLQLRGGMSSMRGSGRRSRRNGKAIDVAAAARITRVSADELVAFERGGNSGFRGEAHNLSEAVETHVAVATFRRAGKGNHILHSLTDSEA